MKNTFKIANLLLLTAISLSAAQLEATEQKGVVYADSFRDPMTRVNIPEDDVIFKATRFVESCSKENTPIRQKVLALLNKEALELATFKAEHIDFLKEFEDHDLDKLEMVARTAGSSEHPTIILIAVLVVTRCGKQRLLPVTLDFKRKYLTKKIALTTSLDQETDPVQHIINVPPVEVVLAALLEDEFAAFDRTVTNICDGMTPDMQWLCKYMTIKAKTIIKERSAQRLLLTEAITQLMYLNLFGCKDFLTNFIHNPAYSELWRNIKIPSGQNIPDSQFFDSYNEACCAIITDLLTATNTTLTELLDAQPDETSKALVQEMITLRQLAPDMPSLPMKSTPGKTDINMITAFMVMLKYSNDMSLEVLRDCLAS